MDDHQVLWNVRNRQSHPHGIFYIDEHITYEPYQVFIKKIESTRTEDFLRLLSLPLITMAWSTEMSTVIQSDLIEKFLQKVSGVNMFSAWLQNLLCRILNIPEEFQWRYLKNMIDFRPMLLCLKPQSIWQNPFELTEMTLILFAALRLPKLTTLVMWHSSGRLPTTQEVEFKHRAVRKTYRCQFLS